jgi:predicted AlkP superfamily pyrophosphatase or phosphodiesterase
MRARSFGLCLTVIAALAATSGIAQQQTRPAPKLIVLIMVDQMRADYVDRFQGDWNAGLKRLLSEGAWFSNAAFPYLTTVTCPGHATVATGAFPSTHGIFQNAWYDRAQRGQIACTDDPKATPVRYDGEGGRLGHSGARLLVPTLADELRAQRSARVVSVALKARSAIMMAGRGADAVTWRSDALDAWETSSTFAARPVPAVKAFVDANPISADYGQVWSLLLPERRYSDRDDGEGETPPKGWTPRFPHPLTGDADDERPDEEFFIQWERSPFADAYVGRFAAALAEAFALGRRDATDMLAVSFSTPDLVGHAFGPRSREVQDLYAHLDRTIGALLDKLDALVGRGQYVVALSSDHGVNPVPEQARAQGAPGGRLSAARLTATAERVAQAALGPGRYVTRISGNDVYFEPGVYEKLEARPAALAAIQQALASEEGIDRVFTTAEVRGGTNASNPLLRAASLSYVPGRSGDMILVPERGYIFAATGTTHATASPDDQRVPVIVMGAGIRRGEYRERVTPADIAPTLAALAGIELPRADGRALRSALSAGR